MADFSIYGGPSEEWLATAKDLPPMLFDISQDPLDFQRDSNKMRDEASIAPMAALAPQVHMRDYQIPTRDGQTIEARSYRPKSAPADAKLPVFLYFHGGGFLTGTLKGDDPACAQAAIRASVVVLNVNYRHTPQFTFPTAWEDSQDAFAWLHRNIDDIGADPSKVVVGGVSAGAQLTASLVLEKHLGKAEVLAGLPDIAGQVLLVPGLAHSETYAQGPMLKMKSREVSSYVENEHAPLVSKAVIEYFLGLLKTGTPELRDTKLNIVNATSEEVRGLPPTVSGIAGMDPFRDEGLLYAKLLAEADVPTNTTVFKGVPHGFRRFGDRLKVSAEWDRVLAEGIQWCLAKPQATGKFDVKVV